MNKRTIFISIAIAIAVATLIAQPLVAAHNRGQRLARLAQYLQLTDAQKAQIKPILLNAREQAKAIRADASLTADQKKAKFLELRKAVMEQIKPILTPEQQQKLAQIHKMKARAGIMRKVMAALGLTDAQKAQMKTIRATAMQQAVAVKNDTSLTADQKKAKFMELRKAAMEQVKSVLTPEQLQKLKDMKAAHSR